MIHGIEIDIQRAERYHACMRALADLYHDHHCRPYRVPLTDRYDVYAGVLSATELQSFYRFVTRSGEMLLLRPDMTLFLARHVAHTLQRGDLPLRLWYSGSATQELPRADGGGQLEQYQSGVEFIGDSVAGDFASDNETARARQRDDNNETARARRRHHDSDDRRSSDEIDLLVLLQHALSRLGLTDSVIHIGSRRLIEEIIANAGKTVLPGGAEWQRVVRAIKNRRQDLLTQRLGDIEYDTSTAKALSDFLMYIGSADRPVAAPLTSGKLAAALAQECARVQLVAVAAATHGAHDIRLDFSEIGDHPYYTNTTFAAYHPRVADKIASGGRYDHLLAARGFDAPAVGFTIFLHRCEEEVRVK